MAWIERLSKEEFEDIDRRLTDVATKAYDIDRFNDLELLLFHHSRRILSDFHFYALQSYDDTQFQDQIPKVFLPFIEKPRGFAFTEEDFKDYHEIRIKYLRQLYREIKKNPTLLKEAQAFLFNFAHDILIEDGKCADPNLKQESSNGFLQLSQMEANVADLYTMLSIGQYGKKEYILGIDDQGNLLTKKIKLRSDDEMIDFFKHFHPHAIALSVFDPYNLHKIVPDNRFWADDVNRLSGLDFADPGKIGWNMLTFGLDHKQYHSSLPHEVVLESKHFNRITVLDAPPSAVYYCAQYPNQTISAGIFGSFPQIDYVVHHSSDTLSSLLRHRSISGPQTQAVTDIVGSIARDMFVCEGRRDHYEETQVISRGKKKPNLRERYIWLPRFKVKSDNPRSYDGSALESKVTTLAPTHVTGHIRRAENASPEQLELAGKYGVKVPEGYTFVREHDRSGGSSLNALYKSKSALKVMFGS